MTPQLRLVAFGVGGLAIAKYMGKDWKTAAVYGLAALAVVAILTIEKENTAIA